MDVVITDHHRPHESLPDARRPDRRPPARGPEPLQGPLRGGGGIKAPHRVGGRGQPGHSGGVRRPGRPGHHRGRGALAGGEPYHRKGRAAAHWPGGDAPGVDALLEQSAVHREPTATTLAFTAIPRINATGRMGAPERAVRLLTCEEEEDAAGLAAEICGGRTTAAARWRPRSPRRPWPASRRTPSCATAGCWWWTARAGTTGSSALWPPALPSGTASPASSSPWTGRRPGGSGRSVEGFLPVRGGVLLRGLPAALRRHPMAAGGHHAAGGCGPLPGGP